MSRFSALSFKCPSFLNGFSFSRSCIKKLLLCLLFIFCIQTVLASQECRFYGPGYNGPNNESTAYDASSLPYSKSATEACKQLPLGVSQHVFQVAGGTVTVTYSSKVVDIVLEETFSPISKIYLSRFFCIVNSTSSFSSSPPGLSAASGITSDETNFFAGGQCYCNGGSDLCFSNPKPTLSLTPAPNQKDPRPAGTETKDAKSTYELIAKVMDGSTPKSGVAVTFAVQPIANSGGHDHHDASRPKGLVNGALTASGVTDGNGEIKVTFQASQIAGTHVVAAACSTCSNTSATKNVDVKVPDLIPFLTLPFRTQQWNPGGIGQTVEHLDNHYLTVAATYRLLEIAAKYRKIWPTAPALTLNDGSLKWGGKFDIDGSWDRVKGRHGEHRIGDNIDIRANSGPGNVPAKIRDAFFNWLRDESTDEDKIAPDLRIRSVKPLWENPGEVNEHFHLRLGN